MKAHRRASFGEDREVVEPPMKPHVSEYPQRQHNEFGPVWIGCLTSIFLVALCRSAFNHREITHSASWTNLDEIDLDAPLHIRGAPSRASPRNVPYLLRTEGDSWRLWNAERDGVLFQDSLPGQICEWVKFRPFQSQSTIDMCIHGGRDNDIYVSASIRRHGRWPECDILTQMAQDHQGTIHLEVGANIGACLFQVLLTTNVTVVAFEPAPTNLFCLTSTLAAMPKNLQERVHLFPIGAGDASIKSTINVARHNRGNGVVGQQIGDSQRQMFLPPASISIERIDSIIDASALAGRGPSSIGTVKIDTQGYECATARGMLPSLLPNIGAVKFELEYKFLGDGSQCSGAILWDLFKAQAGLTLSKKYRDGNSTLSEPPTETMEVYGEN